MAETEDRTTHWRRVWSGRETERTSWYQDEPAPSLAMIDAAGIRPPAAIIDVGGGASPLVDRLLDRGFSDLSVLDIAAPAMERSRARLGARGDDVRWIASDILAWRPDRRWDLWHDRALLHFLTDPAEQRLYAERIAAALPPGGTAILATFALDGPEKCSNLPVCRHDGASLAALVGAAFRLEEERPQEHPTPAGATQRFCWARFRRL
jgi:hypothetical protein